MTNGYKLEEVKGGMRFMLTVRERIKPSDMMIEVNSFQMINPQT